MKGIYDTVASGQLAEHLQAVQARADDRLTLEGEVDLARAMTMRSVALLTKALANEAKPSTIEHLTRQCRDSLAAVAHVVEKAAKVGVLLEEQISVRELQDRVLTKLADLLEAGVDPDRLQLVEDAVLGKGRGPARIIQIS